MGVWGQSLQPLGDFCEFLEKKLFKSHWITFRTCSQPFERTIQRVQLTCSMSIFLAIFLKVFCA